jgi:hypothetical protein
LPRTLDRSLHYHHHKEVVNEFERGTPAQQQAGSSLRLKISRCLHDHARSLQRIFLFLFSEILLQGE